MRALIITPYIDGSLKNIIAGKRFDLVLCADASLDIAKSAGLTPDVVIGDFDHGTKPDFEKIIEVPCEKDDTDTMLCIKRAISLGADDIFIAGGIGGRLDHTVANIQSLVYAKNRGVRAVIADEKNEAFIVPGSARICRRDGWYLSLFSLGGECIVNVHGVKYPLDGGILSDGFPLGVSNEITDDHAGIEVRSGTLLAIMSKK